LPSFVKRETEPQPNYKDFVVSTDIKKHENPHKCLAEGFILGDMDFVKFGQRYLIW